jgi:DUF4097 and DUF4098 domain-containing protein YvlB
MRNIKAVVLGMALALAVAGGALAQQDIREEVAMAPGGTVEVSNVAGSVEITGWGQDRVEVTGTLGWGTERLDVRESGGDVIIEVVLPKGENKDIEGTDLRIRVPRGCDLEVSTVSAGIEVSDVEGAAELQSVSGHVAVTGALREAEVSTVSGMISLVNGGELRNGEFTSVSGNIKVDAKLSSSGRFSFETVSGNIKVLSAGGVDADWDIESFSGSIQNQIGPPAERTSKYAPGKELSFTSGRGGARISIETLSGTIDILD